MLDTCGALKAQNLTETFRMFWLLLCAFVLVPLASSQLYIHSQDDLKQYSTAQLWYEGHWKAVEWVNGTAYSYPTEHVTGNIIIVTKRVGSIEEVLVGLAPKRPLAVVFVTEGPGIPGNLMYRVDGTNRELIDMPVVEVKVPRGEKAFDSICPRKGTFVNIRFGQNRWKEVNDSKFQLVLNVLLSFWELAIILVALWQIRYFLRLPSHNLLSIGPLCLMLEATGSAIRLAHTCVDPFFTYRIVPETVGKVLTTVHFPFVGSSSILLTLFWAEAISSTPPKSTSRISKYRYLAIGAVLLLFVIEGMSLALRIGFRHSFEHSAFIFFIYVILSLILSGCYLVCMLEILRRVRKAKNKDQWRIVTFRFAITSLGYLLLLLAELLYFVWLERPWGTKIALNLFYIALNWIATGTVASLKPVFLPSTTTSTSFDDDAELHSVSITECTMTECSTASSVRVSTNAPLHYPSTT